MDGDVAFNLDQGRGVDERLGLRVDGVGGVGIGDGSNGLEFLLLLALLALVVEFNVTFEGGGSRSVVCRALLHLFLLLGVLLLVRGGNDTPAASPRDAGTETDTDPGLGGHTSALENNVDIVEGLALAGNEGTGVSLLQSRVLVHGEADTGGPLHQGVVRIEVEEVSVTAGSGNAEDVLQRLLILGARGQRLNLEAGVLMVVGAGRESASHAGGAANPRVHGDARGSWRLHIPS